jgi:hypothetical protein
MRFRGGFTPLTIYRGSGKYVLSSHFLRLCFWWLSEIPKPFMRMETYIKGQQERKKEPASNKIIFHKKNKIQLFLSCHIFDGH